MNDPGSPISGSFDRAGAKARAGLRWMYLLVGVPVLTDVIETGHLPASPREWVTEIVAGAVIAALVRRGSMEHLRVLTLARSDALTGLWNRRAFEEAIEDESARSQRSGQPLSLVYMDIDHFKVANDRGGHAHGDRILQQLAAAARREIRARVDRAFRIGGDEFALLLPGSDAVQAETVMTRIRTHCGTLDPAWIDGPLGVSAGIVELAPDESPAEFVRRADEAMYRIKQARHTPAR